MLGQAGSVCRVVTWNLFHGRDHPPGPGLHTWRSRLLGLTERSQTHAQVNRPLFAELSSLLAAWDWDVAFLQEAPPRWFRPLARRCEAGGAIALTSRNLGSLARGVAAAVNPDLIASGEGGSNQLLVRGARIAEVERHTIATRPERRRMLLARLELAGGRRLAAANLHATASAGDHVAAPEVAGAAELALSWAGDDPLVFGGDLNLRPETAPAAFERLAALGLAAPTAPDAIDHLLVTRLDVLEAPRRLAPEQREVVRRDGRRIRLSDHAPVLATFGMK